MARGAFFKVVKPKQLKASVFRDLIQEGLTEVEEGLLKDFKKTTRTWDEKVKFSSRTRVSRSPLKVEVWTINEIYRMVNEGTKRHFIKPKKKGGVLVFPISSTPKTTPRLISSRKGFRSKKMAFSKGHWVSGIKKREFDVAIRVKWRPRFFKIMRAKLDQAAKQSGHAIRG